MKIRLVKSPTRSKIIRCAQVYEPEPTHDYLRIRNNYVRLTTDRSRIGNPPNIKVTSPSGIISYVDEFPNPDIGDALMGNTAEITEMMRTYVPPTFADIFNTWERFGSNQHQGHGPFWGDADGWILQGDSVYLTPDTATASGFVSPKRYVQYTHEVDLTSDVDHPDIIGVVIAYKYEGTTPHMLMVLRTGGTAHDKPWAGWQTSEKGMILIYQTTSEIRHFADPILQWEISSWDISATSIGYGSWNRLSPTRVRVIKNANLITVSATPFRSTDLDHPKVQTISIDLNDYPQLSWAKEARPYGYVAISNPYASYSNIDFKSNENATDTIYNTDNGDVWKYEGGWSKIPQKIWEYLPLPTLITSAAGVKYIVDDDSLTIKTS